MKITKIELKNYRAFYATHTIDTNNKNLLIYGENGSGKTSLYQSIVDFFVVTEKGLTNLPFNKNHWNNLSTSPDEEIIKIVFDNDTTVEFTPNTATSKSTADFERIAKQSPFYTYKRILKTYISDESVERQLLLLLVKEIVATYVDTKGKSILDYWNTLKTLSEIKGNITPVITEYQAEMTEFTDTLKAIVVDLVNQLNDFLDKYFHTNIHLTITTPVFTNTHTNIKDIRNSAKELFKNTAVEIKVVFFGEEIKNYKDFLNEARLSALAICMYLASLKVIPAPLNLKILFLDDIFIGLDMSNRLPLLEILKTEFADYQIFMTTYDRAWFEVAKNYLDKSKWKSIEMYVGKDEQNIFDIPVIIQSQNYFERAKEHFMAFDYPACANYLRKECEKCIKAFLPQHLKYSQDTKKGTINEIDDLETLFNYLLKYLKEQGFSEQSFQTFKTYQKIVFNALSHDDLKSSTYKKELEQSFELVKNLQQLKVLSEVGENTILFFEILNPKTNLIQKYEIQLVERLRLLEQDNRKQWSKSLCNVFYETHDKKCIFWEMKSLYKFFDNIRHSLEYDTKFDTSIWFGDIKDKKGKTLQELTN